MNKYMKFGMPSLLELDSLEQNVALCRKLGLSFIEINMDLPLFQISDLKAMRPFSDIELTLHLPEKLNVWDFNDGIREAYLKLLENSIEIAVEKNIKILNMHMNSGIYVTLPNEKVFLFSKYRHGYLENNRVFADRISKKLSETEITICIENTGIYDNDFIFEALQQLLAFDCFKLTWDTGHDYSSGYKDTVYIKEHFDKVKHLHLHDAIGNKDHLELGEGELNILDILSEVRDSVERVVIETKTATGLIQSMEYLKERSLIS
ncbi:MAG: sugar phosphate isomerase/epimerase [candidate division Zixibacteria bacterium]|nr:sugar phosphate isomerase/epimerase [candidate division Zixibacteria bacterium]